MTYCMRNSGEQVRYRTCNSYEGVQNLSHAIARVVITACATSFCKIQGAY